MGVDLRCDFSGWAATNNVRCSDNTIIRPGAFKENDGVTVPLVWQHSHNNAMNVLGHAVLKEVDPTGMYMYGYFNNSEAAQSAKEAVQHGDIKAISIFANQLKRNKTPQGDEILHGNIREVSLVLAGADPGAYIDYIRHSDADDSDEAIIYNNSEIFLEHSDDEPKFDGPEPEPQQEEEIEHPKEEITMDYENDEMLHAEEDETVEDILNTMNEKQQTVVKALVGKAYEKGKSDAGSNKNADDSDDDDEESAGGNDKMKHDVFDNEANNVLTHSDLDELCAIARNDVRNFGGSFKESFIRHANDDYGIGNIDLLFPDAKALDNKPEFIQREMEWVAEVIGKTKHVPYTRIKSLFADITENEARAKGYIIGHLKTNEFFSLAKRETTPTTVYKKQQLDRDNILDVTTIDVVSWLWSEMRLMLNEEIARAILIGDGRDVSSVDKISETNIRPIATDAELFTVAELLSAEAASDAGVMVEEMAKTHKDYKGSGAPVLFMGVEQHTDMLWVKDELGRKIYTNDAELCSALRVSKIVEVPLMDDYTVTFSGRDDIADGTYKCVGVKVNLSDYAAGTDKGGEINSFNDFDIDYNQYKYLLETRMSGALVKYHAAQSFWIAES